MTTALKRVAGGSVFGLVTLCLIGGARAQPPVSQQPEPPGLTLGVAQLPDKVVQEKVLLLLKAIEGERYGDFTAAITEDFQAALPPEAFKAMAEPLAPRLRKGYDLSYLGDLKKRGYTMYVCKIMFREQKFDVRAADEVLVTITLKDAGGRDENTKVAGFSLE